MEGGGCASEIALSGAGFWVFGLDRLGPKKRRHIESLRSGLGQSGAPVNDGETVAYRGHPGDPAVRMA